MLVKTPTSAGNVPVGETPTRAQRRIHFPAVGKNTNSGGNFFFRFYSLINYQLQHSIFPVHYS